MSIYTLKPHFQNFLRPLARKLHKIGCTANQVTIFTCLMSVALGIFLCWKYSNTDFFYLLPIWMFIRMAFNAIDGMLAREFNQQSALGAYLNELTDVISDAALYLPFAYIVPNGGLAIGFIIFLSALSETSGILGQIHGNARRYDGPSGKSDRAFIFGALGLAYAIYGALASWSLWVLWAMVGLLIMTVWRRVQRGLQ